MVDQRVAYPRSAQGGSKPDRVLITRQSSPHLGRTSQLSKCVSHQNRSRIFSRKDCRNEFTPVRNGGRRSGGYRTFVLLTSNDDQSRCLWLRGLREHWGNLREPHRQA